MYSYAVEHSSIVTQRGVIIRRCPGVETTGQIQASLRDAVALFDAVPALKRRAKLKCRYATKGVQ
jgi:hypothetical protein